MKIQKIKNKNIPIHLDLLDDVGDHDPLVEVDVVALCEVRIPVLQKCQVTQVHSNVGDDWRVSAVEGLAIGFVTRGEGEDESIKKEGDR